MAANKFWGGASSSSESDSDSSSEEEKPQAQTSNAPRKQMARWAEESSSDEEVSQRRVVRSHTDKRYEQLLERTKVLKNHMKIDDFATIITDYEALLKMLDKLQNVVEQDGGPPNAFIKIIASLEEYVEKTHADLQEKKQTKGEKLPENKAKAFNTLRAKVRKGNRVYQEHLQRLKDSPEEFQSDGDDEAGKEDSSESESEASGSSSSSSSDSSGSDSGSDSDSDSDSNSGSASDSDSSDDEESYKSGEKSDSGDEGDEDAARERKMLRWLITPEKLADREKKAAATKAKEDESKQKDQDRKDRKKQDTGDRPKKESSKESKKDKDQDKEEYTPEELVKKITEIAQQRGRRGFDRKAYMEKLQKMMTHGQKQGPLTQLYILATMVSADFDNTGSAFAAMRIDMWNEALTKVNKMLPLLKESYKELKENSTDEKAITGSPDDVDDPKSYPRMQELYVAFVEKLDDELYKALQFTQDVYGDEFQEILGNSSKNLIHLQRTLKFFEETEQRVQLGVIAGRLMEQLYYKHDLLNRAVYDALHFSMPDEEKPDWVWPEDSKAFMGKLSHYVWVADNKRQQLKACLCQAYHMALHDCFQPARDLLHLGNFQEQAMESDVHIQILYNRVVAQMGLCALRLGKIQEAHNCLMDVCQYNKVRELLAQGISFAKHIERTPEQERAERMRQLPYHMHINLEVLDSAHHICAMLLEVPNLAMQAIDPSNKRVISRVLRRALDMYDKQLFVGPPENAKEAVVSSAKALQRGDWTRACEALEELKIWEHIDCTPEQGLKVKEMVKEKVKVEALRTYLFAYASIYDAFHLEQLVAMFDLPERTVHSTISKMMIKEEITAFWDESSKFVLMQHVEPSSLQRLALNLAERSAQAVENNERLIDQRSGGYAFKDSNNQGGGGRWENWQKDGKGKGKGDGKGKGKTRGKGTGPPKKMGGWENARAGAFRGGTGQRGWATGTTRT